MTTKTRQQQQQREHNDSQSANSQPAEETKTQGSGILGGMPKIPSQVNVTAGGGDGGDGGGGSGGSNRQLSGSSVSSQTTTSSVSIPDIPSYHNLGARGATTARSLPSSSVQVDKRAHEKYAKKFARVVPIAADDLEEVEVIVPKNARGAVGSKEYSMYQKLATESIDHKFGVPSHLVTDKSGAEDGDQTRHLFIQQQYVDTLSKIEAIKQRIVEYDMIDVARVPIGVRDKEAANIADVFEYEEAHILTAWDTISWDTAATYQWAINTHMLDEDQISSKWLKMLLFESCTSEMRDVVMLEYGNLDQCFRGGVMFAWILCRKLFGLNRDTTAALVNFLKLFRNRGLRRYQGENVALARKELLAVCSRLCEAKELPQETPMDLLTGLTLCSVDDFRGLFEHKLQQSRVESLEGNRHLSQVEIMGEVRVLLNYAAQFYGSLNMSDKWNQTKSPRVDMFGKPTGTTTSVCWNCGKQGHTVDNCTVPRNEEKIAENRRKWMESSGRSGKTKGAGGGNYEREKWAPPKSGESGVRHIDGAHYAYCGKKHDGIECGWNKSHSTGYHSKWVQKGSSFDLASECPTHELVLKSKSGKKPKSTSTSSSSSTGATVNAFVLPSDVRDAIAQLNDSVRTPSEQLLMESVMKNLRLN